MSGCGEDESGNLLVCAGCSRTADAVIACCAAVGGGVEHLAMAFVRLAAQNGWSVDHMITAVSGLVTSSDLTSPVRFDESGQRVVPPPSGQVH